MTERMESGTGDRAELAALFELRALPGLGDRGLRRLLEVHGSALAALDAPAAEIGPGARARRSEPVRERVRRALAWLDQAGAIVIRDGDPAYPDHLRHVADPPVVLFALGRLELLGRPGVAVIGARRHTHYGAGAARNLAGGLARAGVTVISGLARGIDAIAHRAALDAGEAGGGSIAVLGCGLDVQYPWTNRDLQRRIAEEGLLLTEFLPGEPALRFHFPRRNRVMAGLARAVVVVEATARSGSLITVRHALDMGREVLAVPGPIGRPTSEGTNDLIRDGARIVTAVGDVLEEIAGFPLDGSAMGASSTRAAVEDGSDGAGRGGRPRARDGRSHAPRSGRFARLLKADDDGATPDRSPPEPTGLTPEGLRLFRALDADPRHIDDIAGDCGLSPAVALVALLELELAGHARQLPGKRVVAA